MRQENTIGRDDIIENRQVAESGGRGTIEGRGHPSLYDRDLRSKDKIRRAGFGKARPSVMREEMNEQR